MLRIRRAEPTDVNGLMGFLTANSLTTVGVEDWYRNFFIASDENGTWVGVAGYELYKQSALLRSVAVETASRSQGYGQVLVETVLADARKLGVHTVYLFTETAEPYFKRLGFEAVDRREIEQPVMQSAEVRERCSECQAMRRRI